VHRPDKHIAVIDQHLDRVLERAFVIGPATFGVAQAQAGTRRHPEETPCAVPRVFAHDFSPARLEAACERALALKACSYPAVRTLIQTPLSPPSSPSVDVAHENVRRAKYFQ
jgi:hypothetical protein